MPKQGTDSLFQLIKSLTASEKGYFKKFAEKHTIGKKNNYLKLFDAIDKQGVYDEQELLLKEKYIKQLPYLKNYLQDLILKSLNVYHAESALDIQLRNALNQAQIFYKKGLYDECYKYLNKIKRLGYESEKFLMVLEAIRLERMLFNNSLFSNEKTVLKTLFEEEQSVINILDNISRYNELTFRFMEMYTTIGIIRTEEQLKSAEAIIQHPLMKTEKAALSLNAKGFYYQIYFLYYTFLNNPPAIYEYAKKYLELTESHPALLVDDINKLVVALNNFGLSQLHLKKFQECAVTIAKLRAVAKNFPEQMDETMAAKIFSCSYRLECNIYYNEGTFDKGVQIVDKLLEGIEKYAGKLNSVTELILYSYICYFYFGVGEYKKALLWINKVLSHPEQILREDIQLYTRILNLMTHYELRNELLLKHIIRATYRFMLTKKKSFKVENIFLAYLRELSRVKTRQQTIESFKLLKEELLAVCDDPLEKNALEYFYFIPWIDSKIQNRIFAELVKEKAEKDYLP